MMGRLPTRNRQAVPRLATSLKEMRVMSISAGYAHSVVVTDEGKAFASGQNDRGQVIFSKRRQTHASCNNGEFAHCKRMRVGVFVSGTVS